MYMCRPTNTEELLRYYINREPGLPKLHLPIQISAEPILSSDLLIVAIYQKEQGYGCAVGPYVIGSTIYTSIGPHKVITIINWRDVFLPVDFNKYLQPGEFKKAPEEVEPLVYACMALEEKCL